MRFRQAVTVVVLVMYLPACLKWSAAGVDPALFPGSAKEIRVTLKNGRRIVLHEPVVRNDSLIGSQRLGDERYQRSVLRKFALADVKGLEARKTDGVATAFAVGVVGAMVAVVAAAAAMSDFKIGSGGGDYTCYNARVIPPGGLEE